MITSYKLLESQGQGQRREKVKLELVKMADVARKNLLSVEVVCPICGVDKLLTNSEEVEKHLNSEYLSCV